MVHHLSSRILSGTKSHSVLLLLCTTYFNEDLAEVRRHVIERADRTFVIADFSKFGRTSFYHICNFQQIDSIITDKALDENWHTTLAKYNVKIYDEE